MDSYLDHCCRFAKWACQAHNEQKKQHHIPKRCPMHALRREYAQAMYARIARDVTTLPSREVYRNREDMRGCVYDRAALLVVSRSWGITGSMSLPSTICGNEGRGHNMSPVWLCAAGYAIAGVQCVPRRKRIWLPQYVGYAAETRNKSLKL